MPEPNHYNYFRDYDPSIGRYVQSDPIGLEGGNNTFLYGDGNPLIKIDPSGEAAGVALRILIGAGAAAERACMRISACKKAFEEAKKFCKEVECVWKREKADHRFPNGQYCEHYRLTCYRKDQKKSPPIFEGQWPFPGRCFDRRQDTLSE